MHGMLYLVSIFSLFFGSSSYTLVGISQGSLYRLLGLLRECLELPAWGVPGTAPLSPLRDPPLLVCWEFPCK